jgi:hypothetical protein
MNKYYITEDTFPTIHRRSSIIKTAVVEVSPIENAIKSMKEKNQELLELAIKHDPSSDHLPPIQDFTMVLKGSPFFEIFVNLL